MIIRPLQRVDPSNYARTIRPFSRLDGPLHGQDDSGKDSRRCREPIVFSQPSSNILQVLLESVSVEPGLSQPDSV